MARWFRWQRHRYHQTQSLFSPYQLSIWAMLFFSGRDHTPASWTRLIVISTVEDPMDNLAFLTFRPKGEWSSCLETF